MVNKLYQCDVCGTLYDNKQIARKCQSLGIRDPEIQRGTLFKIDKMAKVKDCGSDYLVYLGAKERKNHSGDGAFADHFPDFEFATIFAKNLRTSYIGNESKWRGEKVTEIIHQVHEYGYQILRGNFLMNLQNAYEEVDFRSLVQYYFDYYAEDKTYSGGRILEGTNEWKDLKIFTSRVEDIFGPENDASWREKWAHSIKPAQTFRRAP